MPRPVQMTPLDVEQPTPGQVVLTFGGGVNTRELPQDIDLPECADGSTNFGLDIDSAAFFRRKPYDLVGTVPNKAPVKGYAQLLNADGTTSTLIQAANTVYKWDGTSAGFVMVGSCDPNARLRGKLEHNMPSRGIVIVTDLSLKQPVAQWDGTTFQTMQTGLSNTFYAKYCRVQNERAWFANVVAGTPTPHLIVGSQTDNPFLLSISNKPSTALGTGDPFFMTSLDLSPINGFSEAFGSFVFSTIKGNLFNLTGTDATNYALAQLYQLMGAAGDEPMEFMGNDLAYGRNGRIESLYGVLSFGNVESSELSRHIAPSIQNVGAWTLVYDRRLYRLYCLPNTGGTLFVYHRSIMDDAVRRFYKRGAVPATVSPWVPWTTSHSLNFQPSCFWTMQRPTDGLWMAYMSDASGNIFQLEGGGGKDGGTTNVTSTRVSKLFSLPDGDVFDVTGYIDFQRWFAATVNITLNCAGDSILDQPLSVNLTSSPTGAFYGGGYFYGGGSYYGLQFPGRVARLPLNAAGRTSHFQATVSVTGAADFFINNIVLNFNQAKR